MNVRPKREITMSSTSTKERKSVGDAYFETDKSHKDLFKIETNVQLYHSYDPHQMTAQEVWQKIDFMHVSEKTP